MHKQLSFALLSCLVAGLATGTAPGQSDNPEGRRWFIDVTYGTLKPLTMPSPEGGGRTRTLWYLVLKLSNGTGESRNLSLVTRAMQPQAKQDPIAQAGLYPEAMDMIRSREHAPELVNLLDVSGELGTGESKSVVIIFRNLSPLANHIDVRVGGLTNTLYREGGEVWQEDTELSIKFHRVGDEFEVTRNKVEDKGKTWVTVKRTKIRE